MVRNYKNDRQYNAGTSHCSYQKLIYRLGATVWAEHGETDQLQGCVLFPYLFNIHDEHILKEAVLEENKSSFKIRGRKKITCAMLMTLF